MFGRSVPFEAEPEAYANARHSYCNRLRAQSKCVLGMQLPHYSPVAIAAEKARRLGLSQALHNQPR